MYELGRTYKNYLAEHLILWWCRSGYRVWSMANSRNKLYSNQNELILTSWKDVFWSSNGVKLAHQWLALFLLDCVACQDLVTRRDFVCVVSDWRGLCLSYQKCPSISLVSPFLWSLPVLLPAPIDHSKKGTQTLHRAFSFSLLCLSRSGLFNHDEI